MISASTLMQHIISYDLHWTYIRSHHDSHAIGYMSTELYCNGFCRYNREMWTYHRACKSELGDIRYLQLHLPVVQWRCDHTHPDAFIIVLDIPWLMWTSTTVHYHMRRPTSRVSVTVWLRPRVVSRFYKYTSIDSRRIQWQRDAHRRAACYYDSLCTTSTGPLQKRSWINTTLGRWTLIETTRFIRSTEVRHSLYHQRQLSIITASS